MTLSQQLREATDDYRVAKWMLGMANRYNFVAKSDAMKILNRDRHRLQQVVLEATYILYPSGRIGG